MWRKLNALFADPRAPWIAAALMLVISLPATFVGFVADDYFHRAILLDETQADGFSNPLTDLFRFVPPGDEADHLREVGIVPWWAEPNLELGFLRPVTAATHMLDYAWWPNTPALQHVHSMLWFGAAVLLVGLSYRQVNGPTAVSGMAVVLFAIEDAHSMNIGWLANRNASIALVFGLSAFLAHIRWRRNGGQWWLAGALGAFTAALLAGEIAIGVLAYIVAWQLVMDDADWSRRLGALAPYAALVVGWRVSSDALGYGCIGSGLYLDPLRQPVAFAGALLERWPVMAGGLWSQINADLWAALARPGQMAFSVVGLVISGVIALLLVRLVRTRSEARFWALGSTLSLVPVAAAFPMARLLLVPGIGAFGLLAMLSAEVGLLDCEPSDHRGWKRWGAKILLVLHGPVAVPLLVAGLLFLPVFNSLFTAGARFAPRDPALCHQSLIFINGHEFPCAYTAVIRRIEHDPTPRRIAILAQMNSSATVFREDDRTLVITADDGWFRHSIDRLMRSAESPIEIGRRFRTPDFEATIRDVTNDGRPRTVAFEFDAPLEDELYRMVHWRRGRLESWPIPRIGGTAELEENPLFVLD